MKSQLIALRGRLPHSTDILIDAPTGQVSVRATDKGQEKNETEHLDLPPDLANGMIREYQNFRPKVAKTTISFLAATPKPRLVKLSIVPQGDDAFSVAGVRYKHTLFGVKMELGGRHG
ncbi:MAG: hypothetical protein M3Y72_19985 [Acidobacteriota bacterium]|nr:hypothetical protein [Acidobacteriota bacterium]